MGARQSSFARSGAQDEGEHESGGPASPASYTIEPIPQGLEHVVYPKYEEAFRLGLAAFSHPMRTNKFKRELPPILGSAEFQNHPNGGITPLPTAEPDTPRKQKTCSTVSSTQDILNSNLRIAAYGSNGEFPANEETNEEVGASEWGVSTKCEVGVERVKSNGSPSAAAAAARAQLAPVLSADAVKSEKPSKSSGMAHTRSTSRADSTLWHSASSGGLPDSPTPSSINMEPSRFTIPISQQNDRLYSPVGSRSDVDVQWGSKPSGVVTIAKANSAEIMDAPTSSTSAPGGYGIKKESPLLEALSLSFANGGLFDADEDFAFEISKLRAAGSQSQIFDKHQFEEEASYGDVLMTGGASIQQTNNVNNSFDGGSGREFGSSTAGSRKDIDDLQLLESVYEEIRQWQYGRDPQGDPGL